MKGSTGVARLSGFVGCEGGSMKFPVKTAHAILSLPLIAFLFGPATAQEAHSVHFSAGTNATSLSGAVKGDGYVDYRLGVNANQKMAVTLKPASVYFNLMPPGSSGEAIFNGSQDGGQYSGTVPKSGTYTVRVYQMGAAASEGKTHKFTLGITVN